MKHGLFLAVVSCGLAADPAGVVVYKKAELQKIEKELAGKIDSAKFAGQPLQKFGNHLFQIAHRQGNGSVELHETQSDIFFVQSGEATLMVGGTIADGKTTAKGEVRGTVVKGAEKKVLGPGDVVHIPAKTPHQLLVEKGKQFTYFVVKVDTP